MKVGVHKKVEVVGCFVGESNEKKTPYFGIEFKNQENEYIEHAFYLTEKTSEKNIETLMNLGFKGKSLSDMANPKFSISDLFGEPADDISLTIEEEFYQNSEGEERSKTVVKWVNVGNKVGLSKMDHATAVKTFKSSTFDGMIREKRKNTPAPKEKSKEPEESFSGDDIPF